MGVSEMNVILEKMRFHRIDQLWLRGDRKAGLLALGKKLSFVPAVNDALYRFE
jgi:hypothetical protein